jgi:hypothetical protein
MVCHQFVKAQVLPVATSQEVRDIEGFHAGSIGQVIVSWVGDVPERLFYLPRDIRCTASRHVVQHPFWAMKAAHLAAARAALAAAC